MYKYKTAFVAASFGDKVSRLSNQRPVDGVSMARDLEALLVQEDNKSYQLHSVIPVNGNEGMTITASTLGLLVVLVRN